MFVNNLKWCKGLADVVLLTSDNMDNSYYVFSYENLVATVGLISFRKTKDYLVGEIEDITEEFITAMLINYNVEESIDKLRIVLTNISGSDALTVILSKQKVDKQALYYMLKLLSKLFILDGIYKYE